MKYIGILSILMASMLFMGTGFGQSDIRVAVFYSDDACEELGSQGDMWHLIYSMEKFTNDALFRSRVDMHVRVVHIQEVSFDEVDDWYDDIITEGEDFQSCTACAEESADGRSYLYIVPNTWVEWKSFQRPIYGYYKLKVTYAAAHDVATDIYMDNWHAKSVTFPSTGGLSQWAEIEITLFFPISNNLINTIRFNTGSSELLVDKFEYGRFHHPKPLSEDLERPEKGKELFWDIKEKYGADLVYFIITAGYKASGAAPSVGSPFAVGTLGVDDPPEVHPEAAKIYFAHEIGHCMGLGHDRFNDSLCPGLLPYGIGYVEPGKSWGTIMSHGGDPKTKDGDWWVPFYSNPNRELDRTGQPLGVERGDPIEADAATALTVMLPENRKKRVSSSIRYAAGGELKTGVPTNPIALETGQTLFFKYRAPLFHTHVTFTLSGPNGDANLYVNRATSPDPDLEIADCHSATPGRSHEFCSMAQYGDFDDYYVAVDARSSFSDLTLTANADVPEMITAGDVVSVPNSPSVTQRNYVFVAPGACDASITLNWSTGNPVLYAWPDDVDGDPSWMSERSGNQATLQLGAGWEKSEFIPMELYGKYTGLTMTVATRGVIPVPTYKFGAIIEAEDFFDIVPGSDGHHWARVDMKLARYGAAMQALPDIGTNRKSNYIGNSPRLDYKLYFQQAGTYYIYALGGGLNRYSDSFHVGLNGQASATSDKISWFPHNPYLLGWSNQAMDRSIVTINIPSPGPHTLNVWMREDGFILDTFILISDKHSINKPDSEFSSGKTPAYCGKDPYPPSVGFKIQPYPPREQYHSTDPLDLWVYAEDNDGIQKVEVWIDGEREIEMADSDDPNHYECTLHNLSPGLHCLEARAFSNNGTVVSSERWMHIFQEGGNTIGHYDFNDSDEGFNFSDNFGCEGNPADQPDDPGVLTLFLGAVSNRYGMCSGLTRAITVDAPGGNVTVSFDYTVDVTGYTNNRIDAQGFLVELQGYLNGEKLDPDMYQNVGQILGDGVDISTSERRGMIFLGNLRPGSYDFSLVGYSESHWDEDDRVKFTFDDVKVTSDDTGIGLEIPNLTINGSSPGFYYEERAYDHNPANYAWASSSGQEKYIEVLLPSYFYITGAEIFEDNGGNWEVDFWRVEYFQYDSWERASSLSPSDYYGWNRIDFAEVETHKVRIYMSDNDNKVQVYEIKLLGKFDPSIIPPFGH